MATSVRGNIYWNTLLRIPVQLICFSLSIFIARLLDPSDFGIMAIAMMCIGYANMMTNFGLNEAIIQQTITCKKTINSIFTVDITLSVILAVTFALGAGIIANFFHDPRSQGVVRLMSLVFIITTFSGIPIALLRRDSNFQIFSLVDMSRSITVAVLTLALAYLNFGYWSLAYGQLIPSFIFTVILCIKTRWKPEISLNYKLLRPVINFGSWSFIRTQSNFFTSHVEKILIGRILGTYSLGIYDKSKSIARVPSDSIFMNINSVMYSTFSKNKKDKETLLRNFCKSIVLISIISFPVYLGCVLIAPYFVQVLLGDKWIDMILPFQIILSGFIFKSFGGILTSFNIAVGNYKSQTIYTILSGFVLIALCFLLLEYGIIGMATAFFIYCLFEFSFYIYLSLSILKISLVSFFSYMFTGMWSSAVMFISTRYLSVNYFIESNLFNMVMLVLSGAIVYVFCVMIDFSQYSRDFKHKIFSDMSAFVSKIFVNDRKLRGKHK